MAERVGTNNQSCAHLSLQLQDPGDTSSTVRELQGVQCAEQFDSVICFPEFFWIGTKEENPEEKPLPFPPGMLKDVRVIARSPDPPISPVLTWTPPPPFPHMLPLCPSGVGDHQRESTVGGRGGWVSCLSLHPSTP